MTEQNRDRYVIVFQALDLEPEEREDFIREACGSDTTLLAQVQNLLNQIDNVSGFLEEPLVEFLTAIEEFPSDDLKANGMQNTSRAESPGHEGRANFSSDTPSDDTVENEDDERIGSARQFPEIPGHEILGEIGRGGMGVVYKARQIQADRIVALKTISSAMGNDPQSRERFRREGRAIAQLRHPGIVQVFEVGEYEGTLYFSLELCSHGSLDQYLAGTPISNAEAARLILGLAIAMQAAHAANIVHRDLKPGNILLNIKETHATPESVSVAEGERVPLSLLAAKVTDFGLAKKLDEATQTRTGLVMGTPSYIAPEQAVGQEQVGPLADVYALGAILYECLTGKPPFKAATPVETVLLVTQSELVPPRALQPGIPRDLDTICSKCLRKDPPHRYQSAAELAADLTRYLEGKPIQARPVGPIERTWRWCRRSPALAALLLFGLLFIGVSTGVTTWYFQEKAIAKLKQSRAARERKAEEDQRKAVANQRVRDALAGAARSRKKLVALLKQNGGVFELLDTPTRWRNLIEAAQVRLSAAIELLPDTEDGTNGEFAEAIDDLRNHLQQDKQDLQTALKLGLLFQEKYLWANAKNDRSQLKEKYDQVFRAQGFDFGQISTSLTIEKINRSNLRELLLAVVATRALLCSREPERALRNQLLLVVSNVAVGDEWKKLVSRGSWYDRNRLEALAKTLAADESRFANLSPQFQVLLGEMLTRWESDAEPWLRKAQEFNPSNFRINFALAYFLQTHGQFTEAIGYYRAALVKRPRSSSVHVNLSGCFQGLGKLNKALACCRKAIQYNKTDPLVHHNLAAFLSRKKEWQQAEEVFRKTLTLGFDNPKVHFGLGYALLKQKKFQEAIVWLKKAILADPDYFDAHLALGLAYMDQDQWKLAQAPLQKALELKSDARAHYYLGIVLTEIGNPQGAIR